MSPALLPASFQLAHIEHGYRYRREWETPPYRWPMNSWASNYWRSL